jgi:hypothetical protein
VASDRRDLEVALHLGAGRLPWSLHNVESSGGFPIFPVSWMKQET